MKKKNRMIGIRSKVFKACRLIRGYSQIKMATLLGLDQSLISRIENGERIPTMNQVVTLEALMNESFEEMKRKVQNAIDDCRNTAA